MGPACASAHRSTATVLSEADVIVRTAIAPA